MTKEMTAATIAIIPEIAATDKRKFAILEVLLVVSIIPAISGAVSGCPIAHGCNHAQLLGSQFRKRDRVRRYGQADRDQVNGPGIDRRIGVSPASPCGFHRESMSSSQQLIVNHWRSARFPPSSIKIALVRAARLVTTEAELSAGLAAGVGWMIINDSHRRDQLNGPGIQRRIGINIPRSVSCLDLEAVSALAKTRINLRRRAWAPARTVKVAFKGTVALVAGKAESGAYWKRSWRQK